MEPKTSALSLIEVLLVFLIGSYSVSNATYHSFYRDAVGAYHQERWFECYTLMKKALLDYSTCHQETAQCWVQCQEDSGTALIDINAENFLQPLYLDVASAKSECFNKCMEIKFPARSLPAGEEVTSIDQEFEDRTPYDYLQICAYKSDQFEDAISAAYTYLAAHPGHKYMENNVKFYQSLPEARQSYFRNLEEKHFKLLYTNAVSAYESGDWLGTIRYMEESLQQYYAEEQHCTALCNAPLEPSRLKLLVEKIYSASNEQNKKRIMLGHWSQVLECKERCRLKLDTIDDLPDGGSYMKEHYNYLQFSYYKLNDMKRAAECTGTYLRIDPSDVTAQYNKDYYSERHQVLEDDFIPRKDAVRYMTNKERDSSLLAAVRKQLSEFSRSTTQQDEKSADVAPSIPVEVFGERDPAFLEELKDYVAQTGITISAEREELHGDHRVAVDGLINSEQCAKLVELASAGASQGDGYRGTEAQTSPHTKYEKFEGLTVNRAAELARDGLVSSELAKLYLDVSELGRVFMKKYFNLKKELMFQYTHLVCRTALDVNQSQRSDLSHPVHSDNCFIQPDGTCLKRPPAYIYRDFTGLIYLNDEFEGGDFFFAHKNLSLQTALRPKCGRFVGFESDDYHGVQPVTSGRRCALAAWYTLTPEHQELAHVEARTILRSMAKPTGPSLLAPLHIQPFLSKRGSYLSMTEDDLNGSQRFAVDDFLTEDQCSLLMKLANDGAVEGDGYTNSKGSPHTKHEMFEGLAVFRASQLAAEHRVSAEAVKLYLGAAQDVLELTRLYLTPETPLYFSYTHLVCRTALNAQNLDRTDLSHPVHSDNCIIQPDNTCKRERPAYTERDFSAILYLNDNFNGGNFFFTHQNMTVQSSLRPKCGRVVAFNASHYHGVRPVLSGQRCAVALWFTLDANYKEPGHEAAWSVLRQLKSKAFGPNEHPHYEL